MKHKLPKLKLSPATQVYIDKGTAKLVQIKLPAAIQVHIDRAFGRFAALSIRHKLWVNSGALVGLLMVVGVITLASLSSNEAKLSSLVNEVQPTVVQSLKLVDQLDRASASLGFYLLSKEEVHKKDYLLNLKKISASMTALRQSPQIQHDTKLSNIIKDTGIKVKKLESYKTQMLEFAENDAKNIPAMKYATDNLNPLAQTMLQNLQEILLSEEDEDATAERKQFAMEVGNLRHYLLSALNELRLYLAFRNEAQVTNFESYREIVAESAKQLGQYDDNFLNFEQAESVASFIEIYPEYFKNTEELFHIHKADDWRQDAYVIRTEIAPLLIQVQDALNKMVNAQNAASIHDSQALTSQVNRTLIFVAILMVAGLLIGVALGYVLTQAITVPINALQADAAQLALGNLDQEIDTHRTDELGSLAKSFAEMRDAIRKKIDDLHVLNATGEDLAGLHSQHKALKTALDVMGEQTHVEYGSVYLYNAETKRLEMSVFCPTKENLPPHKPAKSFKVGEGITGGAAANKQVTYIPDTSKEPTFVHAEGEPVTPRAIICVPMLDGDKVFGVMNFSGAVDEVRFTASDEEFAETISRMTVVTHKNIQMLNVIEEQNRTLEQKVEARTAELRQKTNDINGMLQNMHQGIFTIESDFLIHHEYSAFLEDILETKDIADVNIIELLFANCSLGSNTLDQISAALGAILGEDRMMFDCNAGLLVSEYQNHITGKTKMLELEWDPIINDDNIVEKMMVTVRDVTQLRGLQAEAEQQKWELEVIGQILAISQNKFHAFTRNAHQFIEENEKLITKTSKKDPRVIATLFRNMHTIKGNARTYGFDHITDAVHEAENSYDRLRKLDEEKWDKKILLKELKRTMDLVETYENIYNEKLGGDNKEGVYVDNSLIAQAKEIIENVDLDNKDNLEESFIHLQRVYEAVGTETIQSVLDGIVKSMPDIAKGMGKEPPKIIIKDNGIRLDSEAATDLKNIFTHSFRNAIDHGLETPEERKAAGKPAQGTITLEVKQKGDKIIFSLHDDGRGLPLTKIKIKAIEKGLFTPKQRVSDQKIAESVFASGLTTADNVSAISGRGVGMEAVKKFAEKMGGDVSLSFPHDSKTKNGYRPFDFQVTMPAKMTVNLAKAS